MGPPEKTPCFGPETVHFWMLYQALTSIDFVCRHTPVQVVARHWDCLFSPWVGRCRAATLLARPTGIRTHDRILWIAAAIWRCMKTRCCVPFGVRAPVFRFWHFQNGMPKRNKTCQKVISLGARKPGAQNPLRQNFFVFPAVCGRSRLRLPSKSCAAELPWRRW